MSLVHRIEGEALAALWVAAAAARTWDRERTPEAAEALRTASAAWLAARRVRASRRWNGQGLELRELGRSA